jgi:hypothetical protein
MTEPGRQLRLKLGPHGARHLFSAHFLSDRLPGWSEFVNLDCESLYTQLVRLWQAERGGLQTANEAQTEERFVKPVLDALGFSYTVQVGLRWAGGRRQPDYALFLDDMSRRLADSLEAGARFRAAAAVADAKRFGRPLDTRRSAGASSEDPVAQIIDYVSLTRCPWGLLTNGQIWRLYARDGDLTEAACYEIDLVQLLEDGTVDEFRYFAAFFAATAFATGLDGRSFLDRALADSEANAIAVGDALERQVFAAVPLIAEGLIGETERSPSALADAFDHSLVLLYRLLFCLHAEGRGLLPVDNPHYAHYSLQRQRERLASELNAGRQFSSRSDDLYNDLRALFRIVDRGDPALGVNEYDGGLFSAVRYGYFEGRWVADSLLAPAVDGLYRVAGEQVDYRDLSVRHLGTIYERLLDFGLEDRGESLALVPTSGRHATGSYFTPEVVVDAIVERTLRPLLERRSEIHTQLDLGHEDALESFLELRVLDPAMGSGHFLVSAAAYIARFVASDPSYGGELDLVDIRRRVVEQCLYGVDLNPLAVELARLSLWLTTVRNNEPLTFISNLRTGNSLVGVRLADLLDGTSTLFASQLARELDSLLEQIAALRDLEGRTADDVHAKERLAATVDELRAPLEAHADEVIAPAFSDGAASRFHWEIEFPEVFLSNDGQPREDGGFSAVLGNPPYVRIQELGRELAEYCRLNYETAHGSFDVYVPFIERSIGLLAPGGRLGFIVPNKFLKLEYASRLRGLLAQYDLVEEILDFGDIQLFPGATNYTCVLVLQRGRTQSDFEYRHAAHGTIGAREALRSAQGSEPTRVEAKNLNTDPWILATGEEARILAAAGQQSARLDAITEQIFVGLQTSADAIYIVEDRGMRGAKRVVWSQASGRELELEPDLLHPLASGTNVGRYSFNALHQLLLFPYVREEGGAMRLLELRELDALPATRGYLDQHEALLRNREHGKMDHDGWYAYVYPKSLGAHDSPKLAIPRLCERLHACADVAGGVYLDNVDVNGILLDADRAPMWPLLVLLNSALMDFVFRRGSVPFRGAFYSANKQFISGLPIRLPDGRGADELEAIGRSLHEQASAISRERAAFSDWLGTAIGTSPSTLAGATALAAFDRHSPAELLAVLRRNRSRISVDTSSRTFGERLAIELAASNERLAQSQSALGTLEQQADDLVFDLYELTSTQAAVVLADIPGRSH